MEKSKIVVKGKSNVNRFECNYTSPISEDVIEVSVNQKENTISFFGAKIFVRTSGFDCHHKMITKDLKTLLKSNEYPHIVIDLKEVHLNKNKPVAKVLVKIVGIEKEYLVPVEYKDKNVVGTLNLNIRDFNLTPPKKMLGMVIVQNHIDIHFNLFFDFSL